MRAQVLSLTPGPWLPGRQPLIPWPRESEGHAEPAPRPALSVTLRLLCPQSRDPALTGAREEAAQIPTLPYFYSMIRVQRISEPQSLPTSAFFILKCPTLPSFSHVYQVRRSSLGDRKHSKCKMLVVLATANITSQLWGGRGRGGCVLCARHRTQGLSLTKPALEAVL